MGKICNSLTLSCLRCTQWWGTLVNSRYLRTDSQNVGRQVNFSFKAEEQPSWTTMRHATHFKRLPNTRMCAVVNRVKGLIEDNMITWGLFALIDHDTKITSISRRGGWNKHMRKGRGVSTPISSDTLGGCGHFRPLLPILSQVIWLYRRQSFGRIFVAALRGSSVAIFSVAFGVFGRSGDGLGHPTSSVGTFPRHSNNRQLGGVETSSRVLGRVRLWCNSWWELWKKLAIAKKKFSALNFWPPVCSITIFLQFG